MKLHIRRSWYDETNSFVWEFGVPTCGVTIRRKSSDEIFMAAKLVHESFEPKIRIPQPVAAGWFRQIVPYFCK